MKLLSNLNTTLFLLIALLSFSSCNTDAEETIENLTIEEPQTFCDIEQAVIGMNTEAVNTIIGTMQGNPNWPIIVNGCPKMLMVLQLAAKEEIDKTVSKKFVPLAVRFDVRNATIEVYNNFLATGDIDLGILEPQETAIELGTGVTPDDLISLLQQANSFMAENFEEMQEPEAFFAIQQDVVNMNIEVVQGLKSQIEGGGNGPFAMTGCPRLLNDIFLAATNQVSQQIAEDFAPPSAGTDVHDATKEVYENYLSTGEINLDILQPQEVQISLDEGKTSEDLTMLLEITEQFLNNNY